MKITRLTAAVLALFMLTACGGSPEPLPPEPELSPSPTSKPVDPNLPTQNPYGIEFSVTSGGETFYPLSFGHYTTTWHNGGWIAGDGYYDPDYFLEHYGDKIPTIVLREDISVSKTLGFSFRIGREMPSFGELYRTPEGDKDFTYERLSTLEPRVYYVIISADYRWDYVPEGNNYNTATCVYFFKLQIEPSENSPTPSLPEQSPGEIPLSVTFGGETIYPLEFFNWSTTWENGKWITEDSFYYHDKEFLENYGDEVPTVKLHEDISFSQNLGIKFKISKEVPTHDDYLKPPEDEESFTYKRFSVLEPGDYYVMLIVNYRWDYVPEGSGYNTARYDYFFKLRV